MAIPTELFRFRVVRGVQAQQLKQGAALDLTALPTLPSSPVALDTSKSGASIDPRTWQHWLAGLSTQLALRGDLVAPADVVALLPSDWQKQAADSVWKKLQLQLAISLAADMKELAVPPAPEQLSMVEGLSRLLRIQDLVTALSSDNQIGAGARALQTARDVQALAAYKIVMLPSAYFKRMKAEVQLIRKPGITDLYVVKDEWNTYEAGELARVVNVLPGETFDTRLKHFEKTETAMSKTTQTMTLQETDNSQTQSSSLSQTSTKDASLNVGVNGQVEVSGQYGPTHVQSSLSAQLQSAQSDSETSAFTTAVQTVQRSVKKVAQTITQVQSSRTTVGDENSEDHKLANTGTDVTVGLYRWLSEVHRVQLERYPNRFVLEFEIPEPGAWLRWAMQNAPVTMNNPDPGPFRLSGADHDLSPLDLNDDTLAQLATQWRIQGLSTSLPQTLTLSVVLTVDPATQNEARFATASDNSLTVPSGYEADSWNAEIFSTRTWSLASYGTELTITVGGDVNSQASTGDLGPAAFVSGPLNGKVGGINTGNIPITVYTIALQGFTCVVKVTCLLMTETYRQWQQTAFDQIAAAYQSLLVAYQQELAADAEKPGSLTSLIGPPDLNRARIVAELRRLVIENLMGQRFNGEPAIDEPSATAEPNVQLNQAAIVGPTVQFFEQAFEWENIVYICYPYYWGRRAQWPTNVLTATADPEFDQFLNSGSARVVVPARPGFENLVNYYLYTGVVWGGQQPPAPNDPDYLSIAQEIQSLQTGATDGTPVGSSWEVSLPTTLLWAGNDPTTLPTNSNSSIPAPTA